MDQGPLSELLEILEDPEPAMVAAGNGVKSLLQSHYRKKGKAEPNRLGGKRSNFWADVARSVRGPIASAGKVKVEITHVAIRQKIEGGTIKAKRHKHLAIPVHKESYGRFVRPFEKQTGIELFFIEINGNKFFASSSSGEFEIYYILKKEVTQKPWPGSLPDQKDIVNAAHKGASEVLLLAVSGG